MQRIVVKVFILVVLLVIGGLALDYERFLTRPLNINQEMTVALEPGATQSGLTLGWLERGWLEHPRDRIWLRLHQKLHGLPAHVQAGEYRLRPGRTLLQMLEQLNQGDVLLHRMTVIEGWRFAELRLSLAEEPALVHDAADMSDTDIMAAIGREGLHPEGRFLPETYSFARGTGELEFLRLAALAMDEALAQAWATRQADLPLESPEEALILASIVEKETGRDDERRRVAGVFVERLRRGMRLQTDPTVIYGLGNRFDGDLRSRDLRADTPYNTYTRKGLPPTPIALPGRSSLHAAVNPDERGELYFVSRGDGSHKFSKTLAEHNAAVRRYQLKK